MPVDRASDALDDSDAVTLRLGGDAPVLVKAYEVKAEVLVQPAAFACELIPDTPALASLMAKYPPRTPFELEVAGRTCQVGYTDGFSTGSDGGGTTLTIFGRDVIAMLFDAEVPSHRSFAPETTYARMVLTAMQEAGMGDVSLLHTNDAWRTIRSGAGQPLAEERKTDAVRGNVPDESGKITKLELRAHVGEKWLSFLRRYLDRAGLFLWAGPAGFVILAAPNSNQRPLGTIRYTCATNDPPDGYAKVGRFSFRTEDRHARYKVYSRGGGGKAGVATVMGSYDDPEMLAMGFAKEAAYRDVNAMTKAHADLYARRKAAEERRRGWSLEYVVPGHSWAGRTTAGRFVWAPDTMVQVEDSVHGISAALYVEGVTFRQDAGGRTTTLRLMRPEDLLFGLDE